MRGGARRRRGCRYNRVSRRHSQQRRLCSLRSLIWLMPRVCRYYFSLLIISLARLMPRRHTPPPLIFIDIFFASLFLRFDYFRHCFRRHISYARLLSLSLPYAAACHTPLFRLRLMITIFRHTISRCRRHYFHFAILHAADAPYFSPILMPMLFHGCRLRLITALFTLSYALPFFFCRYAGYHADT